MTTLTLLSFTNNFEMKKMKKIYDPLFIEIPMHLGMNGLYPDLENWTQKDVINELILQNEEICSFLQKNKKYNVAMAIEHIILFPDLLFRKVNIDDDKTKEIYLATVEYLMNKNNDDMIYRLVGV